VRQWLIDAAGRHNHPKAHDHVNAAAQHHAHHHVNAAAHDHVNACGFDAVAHAQYGRRLCTAPKRQGGYLRQSNRVRWISPTKYVLARTRERGCRRSQT